MHDVCPQSPVVEGMQSRRGRPLMVRPLLVFNTVGARPALPRTPCGESSSATATSGRCSRARLETRGSVEDRAHGQRSLRSLHSPSVRSQTGCSRLWLQSAEVRHAVHRPATESQRRRSSLSEQSGSTRHSTQRPPATSQTRRLPSVQEADSVQGKQTPRDSSQVGALAGQDRGGRHDGRQRRVISSHVDPDGQSAATPHSTHR